LFYPPGKITPDVEALDRAVRGASMDDVLARQTEKLLGALGLSNRQQEELLSGWTRLRNRRRRVEDPFAKPGEFRGSAAR